MERGALVNYRKHYNLLVEKARNRVLEGYVERHHIIPKSEGGEDDLTNIVALTAREHYIAHFLLWRENPKLESRSRAFWLMCQDIERRKYTVSSRIYEAAKLAAIEANRTGSVFACEQCNKPHYRALYQIRNTLNKFCSAACFRDFLKENKQEKPKAGWTAESRKKRSDLNRNSKFINKEGIEKFVEVDQIPFYLEMGWIKGRLPRPKRRWIHKGLEKRLILECEVIPSDWAAGRGEGVTTNRKAISKDGKVKYVLNPDKWIKEGWVLGNCKHNKPWIKT